MPKRELYAPCGVTKLEPSTVPRSRTPPGLPASCSRTDLIMPGCRMSLPSVQCPPRPQRQVVSRSDISMTDRHWCNAAVNVPEVYSTVVHSTRHSIGGSQPMRRRGTTFAEVVEWWGSFPLALFPVAVHPPRARCSLKVHDSHASESNSEVEERITKEKATFACEICTPLFMGTSSQLFVVYDWLKSPKKPPLCSHV